MTPELRRLEEQLRTTFTADAWHGPAVLEVLDGVTSEQATARPIRGAHTIWELVLHLAGTYRLVLRRLDGNAKPFSAEEDWPVGAAGSDTDWRDAVATLTQLNMDVRRALTTFPEKRLDEQLIDASPYTAYTHFIGLTQHDLYHAGQIALLKRALADRVPPVDGLPRPESA
jgi:uncharacterized damage-inducible protein DinB